MEEDKDLEILQRICQCRRFSGVYTDVECIFKAIENLIARNKDLEKLAEGIEKIRDITIPAKTDFIIVMRENYLPYIKNDFIPKSKVQEKIEEYKRKMEKDVNYLSKDYFNYRHKIYALQELLED